MTVGLPILLSALLSGADAQPARVPLQRFLLVVGANAGGGDRAKLQYAISDAERFARVMVELGGVLPANEVVLKQPRIKELIDALDALNTRVRDARRAPNAGRVEVVVYYSGHADEQGLLLGADRYPYRMLRERLDTIPADVRIAVLDACASGAFTRLKGGKLRPPFLVDESADMRGHAFLTSSAATESAQESDRIRASYFTHYLISGFRGAADSSGDGKVTLNEAYQFAFNETLGRTENTQGGAQHPSYDINLTGTGDVVMTDVRQTTATIVLSEDLDGRVFIRNAAKELVAEVSKPAGRRVEIGVEPGAYEIRLERPKTSMTASARVQDGSSVTLEARQFGPAAVEATRSRGGDPANAIDPLAVAGRHRLALRFGVRSTSEPTIITGVNATGGTGGIQYTRYVREDIAVTVGFNGGGGAGGRAVTGTGVFSGSFAVLSLPIGLQWNPFTSKNPSWPLKPFLALSIGPVFGTSSGSIVVPGSVINATTTQGAVGGHIGGGADFHFARPFALGISGGYNWMSAFARPVGAWSNYSGGEVVVSVGFLFGKGR